MTADLTSAPDVDPAVVARAKTTLFTSPVAQQLGIRLAAIARGTALVRLPFTSSNVTVDVVVHGGVIATLADISAVCAAITRTDGATLVGGATSNLTISYLRAANGIDLEADARVLRATKRQTVCQVSIREPGAELIAEALVTVVLFLSRGSDDHPSKGAPQ